MDQAEFLNITLKQWAIDFVKNRIAAVKKADLISSRELLNSFAYELVRATSAGVAQVSIGFLEYGRFADMKRIRRNRRSFGREGMKELEEWIKTEGVEKFKSGFIRKGRRIPSTNEKFANEIAWGIVRSKKPRKRKRWYSKGRERDFDDLYSRLLTGYATHSANEIKDSLIKANLNGNS